MKTRLDWYAPGFLDKALSLDLSQFAQEFLSLNDDYVRGYQALVSQDDTDATARQRNFATFARPWGLRFPC